MRNKKMEELKMKYFEIKTPYYGLMKAKTGEEAVNVYVETVADDDQDNPLIEEINEVDRDYALIKYAQATDEEGTIQSAEDILKSFNDGKASILGMDSSLI